ncbi:MAG: glycosyltransferase [Methylobacteriaceae bacterium]|nr:glycosyltransferase [Methylobacteriaceae bacterium]
MEFHLDGHLVGECYYGIRRPDVAKTYPDWPNSDLSGYAVSLPAKTLPAGIHSLRITAFDRVGGSRDIEFSVEIEPAADLQGPWSLRRTVRPAETRSRLQQIAQLGKPTTFCLLLAARTATTDSLGPTIRSLTRQVFADWRIAILLEKGGELKLEPSLAAMLESYAPNVYVVDFDEHATIAGIVRHIRPADRSCYVLMVECGDELGADALLMLALARATDPMADFLYSDERCVSATGKTEAFFKPGWSPSLLLSTDYLGRAWCAHADLFSKAGVTIGDFIRRGCYELALRLTERAARIVRVPCVLFDSSRAQVPAGIVPNHEILGRNLRRRGIQADILPGRAPHSYFVARRTEHRPLVSIIIPTCGSRDLIKICLATLREKTAYKNYEVICVDNSPEDRVEFKQWLRETSDVVIEFLEPFNWSLFNNLGVKEAAGDLLLFLNDDIEIEDENWLGVLVEHALRPEIGIVGPQLLYPDRKVQHAGLFLSGRDSARHAFRFAREDDPGYFGLALLEREVIGVTGACLMVRRQVYNNAGGFNEAHSVINNDLDFCLRVGDLGLSILYTPRTFLVHHEMASRAKLEDAFDSQTFLSDWSHAFALGDPFYHPHLSTERDDFEPVAEPIEEIFIGTPVLEKSCVRKIVAFKVDHIGDFITSLPALRRLKQQFPGAQLHVVGASASRQLAFLEPAIDHFIEFNFFHARSALGAKEASEASIAELNRTLQDGTFDVAIDLRKHLDTRPLLKDSGATLKVGFDHGGKCPWLDISLEWETDPIGATKRRHITDDLLLLVEALVCACSEEQPLLMPSALLGTPDGMDASSARLFSNLFSRPVVCVHPAAGSEMKQWPVEHFAQLIRLILDRHDVHLAIVGSDDEKGLMKELTSLVWNQERLFNLGGLVKLRQLPMLFSRCCLFIGNDSGPKHIAAAVGIPTVAIHSGQVDSFEWGPRGGSAIALRRNVVCAPCYRAKLDDCHRNLACLRELRPAAVYQACRRHLSAY